MPDTVAGYRLLEPLGEGGMGTVWRAEQFEPVARTVAIKVIRLGMDSAEVVKRFELERSVLARLNHDNVAKVFDAGRTVGGSPFFAMELVPGEPLTKFADGRRLPLRARLELFLDVCAGMQHAHQNGVLHRDLKPANILVTTQGDRAVPKIIDFGLARSTEAAEAAVERSLLTEAGQLLGTPTYMSPEQALGLPVDTRSDVYALGVILYELASGELPFSASELVAGGWLEMQRKLRDVEPPRPSRKLEKLGTHCEDVAALRAANGRSLVATLRRDLDWVVMTAIAKEPDRRYQSVAELAADVRRYLAHEPVLAHAPSVRYRVGKFVRRYRVQTVAAALLLATLVTGLVVSLSLYWEADELNDRNQPLLWQGLKDIAELDLWPAGPDLVRPLEDWLERARSLEPGLPDQRKYLAEIDPKDFHAIAAQKRFLAGADELFAAEPKAGNVAGVAARLCWAKAVRALTIDAHEARWREVDVPPQVGLIPLGRDPRSGWHEFYHPASAADPYAPPPERDADGGVRMTEHMGFVFVLLPGGTFRMGSVIDAASARTGLALEADEMPAHEVALDPFFLSKYEVTQAQWRRVFDGAQPSCYSPLTAMPDGAPRISTCSPVESTRWVDAAEVCRRLALALPTEAQWEYACRAGSTEAFAWGGEIDACPRFANVADKFGGRFASGWPKVQDWEDGNVVHAPVGSFAPNAWGLFDMHGNVRELCADIEQPYDVPARARDGLREPPAGKAYADARIVRGGSWQDIIDLVRCADRQETPPDLTSNLTGFRPARRVER